MNDRLYLGALGLVPKNALSRTVGQLAHSRLPGPLGQASVKAFARAYDINIDEAEHPIDHYRSIGEFFTRRLRPGARPIHQAPQCAVSPADGVFANGGKMNQGNLIQAKGFTYSAAEMLGDVELGRRFRQGHWATVYLSPRDYHRVHHPVEGRIVKSNHIPGRLWPVNRPAVENIPNLFCINERVITYVESPIGLVATVMVGATSVGHMSMAYDDEIQSNRPSIEGTVRTYTPSPEVVRGAELGVFHLGSTAVVLFENPDLVLEPRPDGSPIRMGQPLARVKS
ncbi:MAG: archaetidylserine decarboxylase [Bradymonadia bacterium]